MFEQRTIDQIMKIAAAGGGFRLNASMRTTEELMQIAASASVRGAKLIFSGLNTRTMEDLMKIAVAGQGCVFFED